MEIRCIKCNAKFGEIKNLENRLSNNNKTTLEIKCKRCKYLNIFYLFKDIFNKKDIL